MEKNAKSRPEPQEAMSVFDQLMANMAKTKVFPIDPQPISPMPPMKKPDKEA
jgi:hypothetical protein